MVQPNSSLPVIDSIDRSGVRLAHFYSIAKSICWVRPMVLIDEVWTPLQGSGYWRSDCKLSLFVDRKRLPKIVVAENFDFQVSLIEPARYWVEAPLLIKIWSWQRVCTEAIQFSVSGRLRPASFSSDIVIGNLGVERLPDYFLDDFEQGVNTGYFAEFLSGFSGQSGSEFDSASSSGDTVYRSPSPPDYAYALGPPILSPTAQEERLYFVQSPDSSPAASPQQESSSSSSSDVSLHFDSADLPVHDHANTQTSAPVDSNLFSKALEDLRSSLSQRIHESTCEIRSKVNDVEFSVREDLLKMQAWLRQIFQNACEVLARQSTQMNDLKKGLMAPVGTIFQDLFYIKKNQRAQEAKLNALDGQVAAIRNEQLEFQNKISADLLSLSTQFAEIVDYIRGGDAKKGEGGSSSRPPPVRVERRPLPTPQSPRDVAVYSDLGMQGIVVHILCIQARATVVRWNRREIVLWLSSHKLQKQNNQTQATVVLYPDESYRVLFNQSRRVYSLIYVFIEYPLIESVKNWLGEAVQKHLFDTCNQQQSLRVELVSLGVHISAACVGGCLQRSCNHQSLLVIPSKEEEGET
ncbi:hypothetical protein F511_36310 [Dorcoceras hygrometricum]|uniref:Uncharacterized protein n=1 Tax=Dorcoceras hygrometricum TaxID=472368 RepID=A0A2Z7AWL0_9LAMI|nr:hypothetical protein F511_36310 [Dorcoceras hygrometricum]